MPYDFAKTKEILKIRGAFDSHVAGEYIGQVVGQLTSAEEEIRSFREQVGSANTARDKAEAALEAANQTIHRLREGSTGMPGLIDALKSISINPKGAAKVAAAALAKVNGGAS